MMPELKDYGVGDRWFHRPSIAKAGVEVEITGVSPGPPARVEISFVQQRDAPTQLVPPSQLKCRWPDRHEFLGAEAAWSALSSTPDEVESQAVIDVFDLLAGETVTVNSSKAKRGTVTIIDPARINRVLGGELRLLVAGAQHIEDSTGVSYGWSTAVELAHRAAGLHSERVLEHVRAMEAEARRVLQARPGLDDRGRFTKFDPWELEYQNDFILPLTRLLREWCGSTGDSADELHRLREECARLSKALLDAVVRLAVSGEEEASWAIYERAFPSSTRSEWRAALSFQPTRP